MRFEITHPIHFGYMRPPGVYDDLTEEDAANLSAPRPGFPNGYGRVIPEPDGKPEPERRSEPIIEPAPVAQPQEPTDETTPAVTGYGAPTEPLASGTGPNDPPPPPADPEPTACPECGKDFADAGAPAVSLAAHRRAKHH
jgi:hypothetical protein